MASNRIKQTETQWNDFLIVFFIVALIFLHWEPSGRGVFKAIERSMSHAVLWPPSSRSQLQYSFNSVAAVEKLSMALESSRIVFAKIAWDADDEDILASSMSVDVPERFFLFHFAIREILAFLSLTTIQNEKWIRITLQTATHTPLSRQRSFFYTSPDHRSRHALQLWDFQDWIRNQCLTFGLGKNEGKEAKNHVQLSD